MKHYVLLLAVLAIVFAGCFEPPRDSGVDIKVSSLALENRTSLVLGSDIPVSIDVISTHPDVEYTLVAKLNGKEVFDDVYAGNVSKTLSLPATEDGEANISIQVFLKDTKTHFDTNFSNNLVKKTVYVSPYGRYSNVNFTNNTNIHDKRSYATMVSFNNTVEVYSIGFLMRKTLILSPNSTVHVFVHEDVNGTPSNESILHLNTTFIRLSTEWSIIILQTQPMKIPAGDYWIEFYVDNDGYAEVLCSEDAGGKNLVGSVFRGKATWNDASQNCTPYFIVSSRNPVDTYKEYARANGISIN